MGHGERVYHFVISAGVDLQNACFRCISYLLCSSLRVFTPRLTSISSPPTSQQHLTSAQQHLTSAQHYNPSFWTDLGQPLLRALRDNSGSLKLNDDATQWLKTLDQSDAFSGEMAIGSTDATVFARWGIYYIVLPIC